MQKALEGIRVVDLSHVLAAPMATMFLADLVGAQVIHLELTMGTRDMLHSWENPERTAAAILSA